MVPCHAPVCCRHFSRPEICRPLPSSLARARLLGPIRRTSVAIRRRRHCRRLLEKCHLQSAASVGGSAIPRGSLFTSTVMMKLNTAFHLARSLAPVSLCARASGHTDDGRHMQASRPPPCVRPSGVSFPAPYPPPPRSRTSRGNHAIIYSYPQR